jgi:ribosomal protein L6P/L9E
MFVFHFSNLKKQIFTVYYPFFFSLKKNIAFSSCLAVILNIFNGVKKNYSYQLFVTAVNFGVTKNRRVFLRFVFSKMKKSKLKKKTIKMTCAKDKKLKQWHGMHFLMMSEYKFKFDESFNSP